MKNIENLVRYVMDKVGIDFSKVSILDYDIDRIYLAVDSTENNYNIRCWDISANYVSYTLYELNLEENHGISILNGIYNY